MSADLDHEFLDNDARRILIVDDNHAIHDDFRRILSPSPPADDFDEHDAAFFGTEFKPRTAIEFQLEFASQGQEALEKVEQAKRNGIQFAVVFMDIRMPPGWDGIETTQRLWEVDPDLQVVICTAYSDYSWEQVVACLGHTDKLLILRKPFDVIEAEQAAHAFSRKWSLLQQSRRHAIFLEQTMNLSPSMIFWISEEGGIVYANQSASRLLDQDIGHLQSLGVGDVFPEWNGAQWNSLSEQVHQKKNLTLETSVVTAGGDAIPIEAIVTFLDFRSKHIICITAQDIRARIQTLRDLAAARDAALESARMKSQFMATMSHEIRTPMNGVLGMTELLSQTQLTPSQKEYVNIIDQSGLSLLCIINDILDSAKIESGKLEIQKVGFDLREVVKGTIQTVSANAAKKGIRLNHHVDAGIPEYLLGDPGRLRQVLLNLTGNAVKFTLEGSVTLAASLESMDGDSCRLRFSVKDTGIGIDPGSLAKIFHPFTQLDDTNTRSHGGTGLGLTISSQIVQAMGGKIAVHSEAGTGSEFSFSIQFSIAGETDRIHLTSHHPNEHVIGAEIPSAHSIGSFEGAGQLKILLAEDNEVNRKVTLLQLQKIGHRADVAHNGQEALEAVMEKDYDIILMDCQMPIMDGLQACREIRRLFPHKPIRIIALTANAMKEDRDLCIAAGMDDYLSKPIRSEELAAALDIALPQTPADRTAVTGNEPPVNMERFSETTDNDPEFARRLVQDYLAQAEEILAEMAVAIRTGNDEEIKHLAHKLAGSSASCGMTGIVPTMREIESPTQHQPGHTQSLYQQARADLNAIRSFFQRNPC